MGRKEHIVMVRVKRDNVHRALSARLCIYYLLIVIVAIDNSILSSIEKLLLLLEFA